MASTYTAARLAVGEMVIERAILTVEDGRVASIEAARTNETHSTHDFGDGTIVPAFFDIHIHGAANHDVMEGSTEALGTISRFLATRGVGQYLATTVTAGMDETLRGVDSIAAVIEQGVREGAQPIGIHLEGPFVSHAKRGVHPPEHIVEPTVAVFDRIWQAGRGTVKLMTIAPELPGALEVIRHATDLGVRVSLGHSNATAAETLAGIRAGAVSATHTFNAMRPLDHREPGICGVVLDSENLFAELICDGIHVAPEMVRLFAKAKGREHGILITDGMSATGMPDGEYMLGGFKVQVADGVARSNGALAGSVLTMDRAVMNYRRFTSASVEDASQMASANPAAMLGLPSPLSVGTEASFNVLRADGSVAATVIRGELLQ